MEVNYCENRYYACSIKKIYIEIIHINYVRKTILK